MPRFYVHGILLILLVSFCIFFGVDIATKGMENVQGPFAAVERAKARSQSVFAGPNADAASKGSSQAAAAVKAEAAIAEAAKAEAAKAEAAKAEAAKKPEPQRAEDPGESAVNRTGNKIGDLLQILSYHVIRIVVSLFDALIN